MIALMNASARLNDCTTRTFACFDAALLSAPKEDRGELSAIRGMLAEVLKDESHPLIINNGKSFDPQHFTRYGELALSTLEELRETVKGEKVHRLIGKAQDWFRQVLGQGSELVPWVTPDENEPATQTYTVINEDGRREVEYTDIHSQ